MFVVVASHRDSVAARTVAGWGASRARLLTCADLSREGWQYEVGAASRSVAVVGGERVRAAEIDAVLVRLPYVPPEDLASIVQSDRGYVAQEMTAFLTAWLTELGCPVLNRPTAQCLGGPGWSVEQWRHAAASLGIACAARARGSMRVTVVGNRCIGSRSADVCAQARRLAHAAGCDLLELAFTKTGGVRFLGANPWPDVSGPAVAEALGDLLARR